MARGAGVGDEPRVRSTSGSRSAEQLRGAMIVLRVDTERAPGPSVLVTLEGLGLSVAKVTR